MEAEQIETQATTEPTAIEERTVEQQMDDMRKISEMRFKSLSQLVELHVQSLTRVMLSSNGVSELEKRQANTALVEAIRFALDMGLSVTEAKIRQGGKLAKEVNTLAGVLVQALDTRMLLLADNMRRDEQKAQAEVTEENKTETQGEENGIA